ncbi:trigger factor [Pediococcus ethanolidurans]|uniref:trigger factor n=1 Tax=Pediococcus ethanolidurans TaxID=319653 RepID=UPI001C1EE8A5|nr:trigger factor [Pediococcus ethanolidurans]MBU7555506.1 trigger factor [Pediococcus ethanolidurans]MBU7563309.1 trigger factor [Pediococcus ethanolidurans]MCT4397140.1 trigger factor [Pediococcus ethanolidurans]MCV3320759.1 trigger factor [Pediococcus ethanolidurans]MCV3322934.1 trigger factor [Pediococcus ethanolidurans]
MTAKWEKKSASNGELTFEISTDKIQEGLDKAFQKTRKQLNVPGFRKGRVPRQIFNQMYGEEALYEDALNIVLPEAYEAAIEETKIEPVDQPKIDVDSMEKGKAWVLKAVVTVKPDVKLGDYKGLSVAKQSHRVTSKEVDADIEKKREQQAELVLKEDKPAEKGDTVTIDFVGTVDGKPFDGGKAENYDLELGSNSFIPGFEDQLIGHKSDDKVDVKVTFPDDYNAEDLQGKEAVFAVTIHEIKTKELPELDDEFAKDVDEEVDSLEELKAKTHDELKKQKDDAAAQAKEDEAIQKAVDNAEVKEVPQAMIDEDVQRQLDQYLANMQQQGIDPKTYYKITGTSEDDLKKQLADGAENRVKTNLVLEAIVEAEKIVPTADEVAAEIKDLASQYGMEESAVKKALSEDMLKHDIAVKKAVAVITDSAVEESKAKAAKKDDTDKEAK